MSTPEPKKPKPKPAERPPGPMVPNRSDAAA